MTVIGIDWRGFGAPDLDWRGFGAALVLRALPITVESHRPLAKEGAFLSFHKQNGWRRLNLAEKDLTKRFCRLKIL